jgi:hypothetical protein
MLIHEERKKLFNATSGEKRVLSTNVCTISIFCQGKAKIIEKAQFTNVNEHFEIIFNAALAKKTTRGNVSCRVRSSHY